MVTWEQQHNTCTDTWYVALDMQSCVAPNQVTFSALHAECLVVTESMRVKHSVADVMNRSNEENQGLW